MMAGISMVGFYFWRRYKKKKAASCTTAARLPGAPSSPADASASTKQADNR
jgi:hypothetical protein